MLEKLECQEEKTGFTTESCYDVIRVPVNYIASLWSQVFPLLEKSKSANPNLNVSHIIEGLSDESIQLWIVVHEEDEEAKEIVAAFLTSIERDKGEWVVSLYNLGGRDARNWVMDCHEAMQAFARREDCRRVRLCGRPAWQRILPDDYAVIGEKQGHLVYERAVS